MKKFLSITLALCLIFSICTVPAFAAEQTATKTASKVTVDSTVKAFDAYTINGNNYFKLRDIAYILSGTSKQFEVTWDGAKNAINLISGKAYTSVGGEMAVATGDVTKSATASTSKIYLNGQEKQLTAYTIDGNNYFKLRDLGLTFDFGVEWDGKNNTVAILSTTGYVPETPVVPKDVQYNLLCNWQSIKPEPYTQFYHEEYYVNSSRENGWSVSKYHGSKEIIAIHSSYDGKPIREIDIALPDSVRAVVIPDSVVSIVMLSGKNLEKEIIALPSSYNGKSNREIELDLPDSVKVVVIPSSVVKIISLRGKNLKEVYIPSSVQAINPSVFSNTKIRKIKLPEAMTEISERLFNGCGALTKVVMPPFTTTILKDAFANCTSLKEIVLPTTVKRIEEGAFCGSGIERINLNVELEYIGNMTFWKTSCRVNQENISLFQGYIRCYGHHYHHHRAC